MSYDFFEAFLRAFLCRFVGSTTTKSASSHVNGGVRRRSLYPRSDLAAAGPRSRRSSRRRSHVRTTGSSPVFVFSASKRRSAPRRTMISTAPFFFLAGALERRAAEAGFGGMLCFWYRPVAAISLILKQRVDERRHARARQEHEQAEQHDHRNDRQQPPLFCRLQKSPQLAEEADVAALGGRLLAAARVPHRSTLAHIA